MEQKADTIALLIPIVPFVMSFDVRFPISMFEPTGALEHRLHRAKFMAEVSKLAAWSDLYYEYAEIARKELLKKDPLTVRPPLERLEAVIVDTAEMQKAVAEEVDAE